MIDADRSHQIVDTCQVKATKASYRMLRKEKRRVGKKRKGQKRKENEEKEGKERDVMRQVRTDYSTVYLSYKGT